MSENRIKFYPMSKWVDEKMIKRAEELIDSFEKNKYYNVDEMLELYNVVKYIEAEVCFSNTGSDDMKKIAKEMRTRVHSFFANEINNDSFENDLEQVSELYQDDFF